MVFDKRALCVVAEEGLKARTATIIFEESLRITK